MAFTDIFIRRPVLATVVSLLIILLGMQALNSLTIRQYPEMENVLIALAPGYPGATVDGIWGILTKRRQGSLVRAGVVGNSGWMGGEDWLVVRDCVRGGTSTG